MLPSLSIIIVNYKTPHLLINCLISIVEQTTNVLFEVIIVDNASGDNSREIVMEKFPSVRWIQMSYNSGFARANNEGIRQSKGEIVLLLNSDTITKNRAIERCYNLFVASDYVACGVQLSNEDGTPQISGNYFMKGGLNYLLPLPYVGNLIKWLGNVFKVKKPNIPDATDTVEVDWINGAFLMVKKQAIEKVGLMDEDFFLYAEEAEWCSRLREIGKLCIYGECNVIHLQGVTANTTFDATDKGYYNLYDRKGLQIMLSNFVRIRKQFGMGWFLLQLVIYSATIPVYFIIKFLDNLFHGRKVYRDFDKGGQFAQNVFRLWKYFPTISSKKPHFYKVR